MRINPLRLAASRRSPSVVLEESHLGLRSAERIVTFEVEPVSKQAVKELHSAMGRQLDRALERNSHRGGVSLRISQGDTLLFARAAGYTDRTRQRRMSVETPFDIASITKSFTAAVVLKLVERQKLSLDSPLSALLPKAMVKGFDPKITVRELLSHTSGLPDYWTDRPHIQGDRNAFLREFIKHPKRRWKPAELLAYAKKLKRIDTRGKAFHYSDTNYVLLGLIIERIEGKPLEEVFGSEIFKPLELKETYFSHGKERSPDPSQAHRFEGKEDLYGVPRQSADWAGGGLVSSTKDLEKFFLALRGGEVFDSAKTTKALLAQPTSVGEKGISYGLGVYQVELGKGRGSVWGHDGHGNSFAYYWPEKDIVFTGTLNQTENDWWPMIEKAISILS